MAELLPLTKLVGEAWDDYGLMDSGAGRKLERYGPYRFIRPEPQAMWQPALPASEWDQADGEFIPASDDDGGGRWYFNKPVPQEGWPMHWREARFQASCTPFRHLGFFPDMAPVWDWLRSKIDGKPDPAFLNLFGYTGVGSQALAAAGAAVTHVDASKKSVSQARENAALADMADRPMRWIVDDAGKFTAREVRRGRRYDAILMDPPKFGRGPNGERWQIEDGLADLLADSRQLLDEDSRALFLTVYAVRMSALSIGELMRQLFADLPGQVECGELVVKEEARGLLLPTAIFARWSQ